MNLILVKTMGLLVLHMSFRSVSNIIVNKRKVVFGSHSALPWVWDELVHFASQSVCCLVYPAYARLYGTKRGASAKTLVATYLATIQPILEYAAPVWSTILESLRRELDTFSHPLKCCLPPSVENLCVPNTVIGIMGVACLSKNKVLTNTFPAISSVNIVQTNKISLTPVRKSEGGSHVGVWIGERALGLALTVGLPLSIIAPNPVLDYTVVAMIVVHAHWGLEAIAVDYVRKDTFGPVIPKIAYMGVYALSIIAMGGLFYFNYNDVGFGNAVRMLWKL
ncbi:Succinate dehydrogenase [ubiquinone] cytochrome b small subunit, mitochondrial [Nymphon striatum]|nr:Succinate dehydrogenase [ubiquinone] cytochrome b small subunit, mitochondrial [Nymphon striatum]